jgi:hypothetical protein
MRQCRDTNVIRTGITTAQLAAAINDHEECLDAASFQFDQGETEMAKIVLRDNQDESPRDNQDERDLRGLR